MHLLHLLNGTTVFGEAPKSCFGLLAFHFFIISFLIVIRPLFGAQENAIFLAFVALLLQMKYCSITPF